MIFFMRSTLDLIRIILLFNSLAYIKCLSNKTTAVDAVVLSFHFAAMVGCSIQT